MYGKDYWHGKEVEGRLSDVMTLFVRKDIPNSGIQDYPHIYFTIEYVEQCCKDNNWSMIDTILSNYKRMVTLEANVNTIDKIPLSIFNLVHIIYRITDPNIDKLKKFDTISIDTKWYNTYQMIKCQTMHTTNDDYKYDLRQ